MTDKLRCSFANGSHNYTTVVQQHFKVPGPENEPLDRTYTVVICTKCGDVLEVKHDLG